MAGILEQDSQPFAAPVYTIDLSLKPRERYKSLTAAYRVQMQNLTGLFNALLTDLAVPNKWLPVINRSAKLLLRRVSDTEQTEELRGIAEESAVPLYLLVAFNVLLDLLMGCTSGAVRSLERGLGPSEATMLHFRTLDWTMDPLRSVIVQLNFVRSQVDPQKVVASSITYAGFVGVLTGVREKLSISLNFRAMHDATTKMAQFRFYLHHLLVLLGRRPSIAAILRDYLLDGTGTNASSLATIVKDLEPRHTTAAYIILSDGQSTISVEKDLGTAKVRGSSHFIATTNHDVDADNAGQTKSTLTNGELEPTAIKVASGMEDLLEDSKERLDCITKKWKAKVRREYQRAKRSGSRATVQEVESSTFVTRRQVIEWLSSWPTTNESTHFAAVLDPKMGQVVWSRVYPVPPSVS